MRNPMQYLLVLVLLSVLCFVHTKSIIEPCTSSDSCPSLLSYLLPYDSKLSEIASRFNVTVSDILAANSVVFPIAGQQTLADQILPSQTTVKIPISCDCIAGIRRSVTAVYTVRPSDTVEIISEGFGGLVSAEQIATVNSINTTHRLENGEKLEIPLPCACLNNVRNGETTVYMSYVVREGDSLKSIAADSGTTVSELETLNGFGYDLVDPGDVIAIPIAACSSATLNWYNETLIVPNGSYALTASNCIKCSCTPTDLRLQCGPSGLEVPCFNLRCKDSSVVIGDEIVTYSNSACNVSQCLYRGHRGGKILRSMTNTSYLQCPENGTYNGTSLHWPLSRNPVMMPLMAPSPSPSPFPNPVSDASPALLLNLCFQPQLLFLLLSFYFFNKIDNNY